MYNGTCIQILLFYNILYHCTCVHITEGLFRVTLRLVSAATPQSFGLSHMLSPVPTFAKYFFPSPVRCLSHPSGNSPIESNF